MTELGTLLKQARIDQGLTIDEMATRTKIKPRFLQAIEEEQFDQLPGKAYVKPFIRTYGKALGLDEGTLLEYVDHPLIFDDVIVGIRERRERLRIVRRRRFALRFVVGIVVLAGIGYLVYRLIGF